LLVETNANRRNRRAELESSRSRLTGDAQKTTKGDRMEIQSRQPSSKGPADRFTGDVWIDSIAQGEGPSRVRVNKVRFAPGARTAWHSHALGQTLHITEGAGLA
jgi:hypothetical protein